MQQKGNVINVIVAGHQFADPGMWMIYLANRFNQPIIRKMLYHPDDDYVRVELSIEGYRLIAKAPVHPWLNEENSYRQLFTQHADVVIYIHSIIANTLHLTKRDFQIVSGILAELPRCLPVLTLLNDSYCGKYHGSVLPDEELHKYVIPGSRVFRTAIGYRPNSGDCSIGADEVFDELLAVCGLT